MAYNRKNYLKEVKRVLAVYTDVKQEHIPDTFIVRSLFPKHGIHISYRKWMIIKGFKPSDLEPEILIAV